MSTHPVATDTAPLLARTRKGAIFLAVLTPLGPLAMAGWAFASPYVAWGDIPQSAAAIVENPVGSQFGLLFISLSAVFGAIGALVVGAAVRRGSPRFGAVAAAVAFVGFVVAQYPGPIAAIAASEAAGIERDQLLALIAAIDSQVQGAFLGAAFACLPAGILLLGIAALISARGRRYPLWAAILLIAAMPVVILTGMIPGVAGVALGLGWVFVAAAFAAAGAVYLGSSTVDAHESGT